MIIFLIKLISYLATFYWIYMLVSAVILSGFVITGVAELAMPEEYKKKSALGKVVFVYRMIEAFPIELIESLIIYFKER